VAELNIGERDTRLLLVTTKNPIPPLRQRDFRVQYSRKVSLPKTLSTEMYAHRGPAKEDVSS